MAASPKKKDGGVDVATLAGVVLALGAILGGLVMEGGKIGDVLQSTAALIVLGGTCGAVMVATPTRVLKGALRRIVGVVLDPSPPLDGVLAELLEFSKVARKGGLLALAQSGAAGGPHGCAAHTHRAFPERLGSLGRPQYRVAQDSFGTLRALAGAALGGGLCGYGSGGFQRFR